MKEIGESVGIGEVFFLITISPIPPHSPDFPSFPSFPPRPVRPPLDVHSRIVSASTPTFRHHARYSIGEISDGLISLRSPQKTLE